MPHRVLSKAMKYVCCTRLHGAIRHTRLADGTRSAAEARLKARPTPAGLKARPTGAPKGTPYLGVSFQIASAFA
jgi:hypothetical protein